MKLSEALRIGIQKRPVQAFGGYLPTPESSCAVGAIVDGFGLLDTHGNLIIGDTPSAISKEGGIRIGVHIPALMKPFKVSAEGCSLVGHNRLWTELIYLNDTKKMSREAIADWLESIGE